MDGAVYETLLDMLSQIKNTADRMALIVKNKKGRGAKLGEAVNDAAGLFRTLMPYFENDLQNGEPFNLLASELVEMISYCNGEDYEEESFSKRCAAFAEKLKQFYQEIIPAWKELIYLEMQPELFLNWVGSYRHYYFMRKMKQAKNKPELKTLVTGLSYALYGVDDDKMDNAINLSFISQDLYYSYAINKALLPVCPSIKYSIVGISNYTPFFDISSSTAEGPPSVESLYWPALRDAHNCKEFRKNLLFSFEGILETLGSRSNGLFTRQDLANRFEEYWEKEFGNSFFNRIQSRYLLFREDIFKWDEARLHAACLQRGNDHNKQLSHMQTKTENQKIFDDFLTLCEGNGVIPIFVMFPGVQYYREAIDPAMTEALYGMLEEQAQNHSFLFLDYFNSPLFTAKDFTDMDHLSEKGCQKMTFLLNQVIEQLEADDNAEK